MDNALALHPYFPIKKLHENRIIIIQMTSFIIIIIISACIYMIVHTSWIVFQHGVFYAQYEPSLSLLLSVSSILQSLIDCQPNTAWKHKCNVNSTVMSGE